MPADGTAVLGDTKLLFLELTGNGGGETTRALSIGMELETYTALLHSISRFVKKIKNPSFS